MRNFSPIFESDYFGERNFLDKYSMEKLLGVVKYSDVRNLLVDFNYQI